MSQENVEIVRAAIDAFQHDEEAWLRTLDRDVVWYPIEDGHIPRRGIEEAMGIRQRWLDTWEEHTMAVEDLRDVGENVVGTIHIRGRGKGSGIEVNLEVHQHFKLRAGRIVYLFEYADRAEALEAAGLRE